MSVEEMVVHHQLEYLLLRPAVSAYIFAPHRSVMDVVKMEWDVGLAIAILQKLLHSH